MRNTMPIIVEEYGAELSPALFAACCLAMPTPTNINLMNLVLFTMSIGRAAYSAAILLRLRPPVLPGPIPYAKLAAALFLMLCLTAAGNKQLASLWAAAVVLETSASSIRMKEHA